MRTRGYEVVEAWHAAVGLGEEQRIASVFEVRDGRIARIARHSTPKSALREGCVGEADAVAEPPGDQPPDGYFCSPTLRKPSAWKPPFETVPREPRR